MKTDKSRTASPLLTDPPVGHHFAQLHRDADALTDSVSLYVETGLRRGSPVLVIVTSGNKERYLTRLMAVGLEPGLLVRSGQLELIDADAMLDQFMRRGMPDWGLFRRSVGAVFERLRVFGPITTRAYGEMVSVLWQSGDIQAAIRLEEYWNELRRVYPFSLFCTYLMDSHSAECYARPIHHIGQTHSEIIPTEDDARFRRALDAASRDIFGAPLSPLATSADGSAHPGEARLPEGQRTMLWLMRNLPGSSATVLERARRYAES